MLKYFSVKNWGPFKDKVEWVGDMLNPKNKEYYDGHITSMAFLYGKNLAGKTILIEALKFIKDLVSGHGKMDFWHTDYYYNGPKDGSMYKSEMTNFIIEFASHEKIFRYELDVQLKDRSIFREVLLYKDIEKKPYRKFKPAYIRDNYTDVSLKFDFGEFCKFFEKYFADTDETVIHRLISINGATDIEEINVPYLYFKNNLHFVDEESFIATETGVNLQETFIPELMEKLSEIGISVDGYDLRERTDKSFIDLHSNEAGEIRNLMSTYEDDSVNIFLVNNHGIYIITNTTESIYKCYHLVFSRNGIPVDSKGLNNIVRLAIILVCTDDGTYIYDDFITGVDERYIKEFLALWAKTVRYKQFIAVCSNTNYMDYIDRADVSFIVHDNRVANILNPMRDLKWRNDKLLSKGYLEEV